MNLRLLKNLTALTMALIASSGVYAHVGSGMRAPASKEQSASRLRRSGPERVRVVLFDILISITNDTTLTDVDAHALPSYSSQTFN